jgi:serine/threonine protein kinase
MYPRPESLVGKEVDGHRIEAVLGRGGMGIVFKAENIELNRTVALKMINPALAQDDSFIRRFRLEARALAQIQHPNIVQVYAFRPFDLGYYISLEYVHGPTLAEYLEANGALSWNEAVFLLKQMLSAFHFAHSAGVIHRDIKPRNILLAPNNVVKITDFGLAKVVQEGGGYGHDTTVTVATGGTIHYMPPEQIRGLKNVDHRGDLFSLGMTMYESLSGALPFDKNASGYTIQKIIVEEPFADLRKNNPDIPRALGRIIMRSLEKDPEKRFQSAAEMRAAIDEFEKEQLTSGATTIYANGPEAPGVTLKTSRGRVYSLVAATAVCLLLALLFFYRPNRESNASDTSTQNDPAEVPIAPIQPPAASATVPIVPIDSSAIAGPPPDTTLSTPPAPTPPIAEKGGLRILSEPSGARIRIGERDFGFTPAILRNMTPGTVQVTLLKEAFLPTTFTATIDPGAVREYTMPLRVPQGTILVTAIPYGDLYVGNTPIQAGVQSDYPLQLPAATHTISIRHPEFGEWRRAIDVKPGDSTLVMVDFTQRVQVTVTARYESGDGPAAEVILDGVATGTFTPARIEVPVGLHRVEVAAEGYDLVTPAEPINFDMTTRGPLRFTLRKQP